MAKIKNIVFDLGGVFIDLDHDQAVRRFKMTVRRMHGAWIRKVLT